MNGKLHILLLINPKAGGFSRERIRHFIIFLERGGAKVELFISQSRHDARMKVRRDVLAGCSTHCVVGGGDGTIADIVSVLIGTPVMMGILPIGTVNVLARELSVPMDDERNAGRILYGETRTLWPGIAVFQDRRELFVQMAGIGLDGASVHAASLRLKRVIGRYAYGVSALWSVLRYRKPSFTVVLDGVPHTVASVIVSKGRFYGGAYCLSGQSQVSTPYFNVTLIKKRSMYALMRLVFQVVRHHTVVVPGVSEHRLAENVRIQSEEQIPTQTDGDAREGCPLACHIAQKPLWVSYGQA